MHYNKCNYTLEEIMKVLLFDGTKARKTKLECETFEDAEKLIRECAAKPLAWLSFCYDKKYPSLDIDINGELTALTYFNDEESRYNGGEPCMWAAMGNHNGKVEFLKCKGKETQLYNGDEIVPLEKAIECVKQFFENGELPDCVEWDRIQ